jgi:nucleosome binding factor SPN SPT16 subunit
VVCPINGFAVPFHISTIKNVTKTEESDYVVLRINFQSPGQIAGKKEDMVGGKLLSAYTLTLLAAL